ncbi:piggyBac transposable element-derived protein 4-like [Ruditapes philippinarum]|uniref:piggyBac transposable element-derived protein 4-like n=1 Tax=Ruditapes philippinarum TaxID=129788 RepID=UPI00295AF16F|nr:piggyBac transposable element-derived protein 4-like [Ruditapes philippinarum]
MYAELVDANPDLTQTTKVVVGLLARSGLLDKGHKVYLDNYYNSPELASELDAHDTYMCGTVRSNRKNMPKVFPQIKLRPGESVFRRCGNILVIKFHEKRDVHMISTIHEATYTVLDKRRHGDDLVKPTSVVDYCQNMGGIDLSDQLLQYYEALRRTVKWWKKLFFHMLNMLVLNSYKLFLKYGNRNGATRRSHQQFRSKLVRALIQSAENAPRPKESIGRKLAEPLDRLLGTHHLPIYIPAKIGAKRKHPQRDCVACNQSAKKRDGHKRQQSIYMCEKCNVVLCIPDCFRIYHSYKDYKRILQNNSNDASSVSDDD